VSAGSLALLTLHFVPGIGARSLVKLAAQPRFLQMPLAELGELLPALRAKLSPEALDQAAEDAQNNLRQMQQGGGRLISVLDAAYPAMLARTPDHPALLFVKGELQTEQTVAVIGTREPTAHGSEIARRATTYLAERGWSIVSGLALGIDAAAHQAALDVGGHTVAVLAHGLQTIAPRQHASLAERILAGGGALVSEYPYGVGVYPPQFVRRDRTQAGLSQGVLMVQSDLTGGSLHASRAAVEYGRPLAVPRPTPRDVGAGESKVQANLVLLGSAREAAALLQCREDALGRLMALNTREDYPKFVEALRSADEPLNARLL
jgi:DNA processing protein